MIELLINLHRRVTRCRLLAAEFSAPAAASEYGRRRLQQHSAMRASIRGRELDAPTGESGSTGAKPYPVTFGGPPKNMHVDFCGCSHANIHNYALSDVGYRINY